MQFLAYIVVMLVSIGGILVELDWLTKPKLETKSPVQVASTAVPPRVVLKVDGPAEGPSPIAAKKPPEDEKVTEPPLPTETTGAAPAGQAGTAPPMTPAPFPPVAEAKAETKTDPAPRPPAQASPEPPAQAAAAASAPQPVPVAAKAPNSCDVQGCTSAYQSFRASDCTYQPMEGPRKICATPPSQRVATTPQNLRKPGKDAELRDVERAVRRITAGDDADTDPRMGRSEVIVIERPERDW